MVIKKSFQQNLKIGLGLLQNIQLIAPRTGIASFCVQVGCVHWLHLGQQGCFASSHRNHRAACPHAGSAFNTPLIGWFWGCGSQQK